MRPHALFHSWHPRLHSLVPVFALLVALAVLPAPASAGIARMSWDECAVDGGVQQRIFACDVNTGSNVVVGTFTLAAPIADFVGVEVVVDLETAAAVLPEWWKFNQTGSCRQNELNVTFDWSVLAGGCGDPYAGEIPQGGIAGYYYVGSPVQAVDQPTDPSRARLKIAGAVANAYAVTAGVEYYAFRLRISNPKTVGTGSCDGCLEPMCMSASSIKAAGLSGSYELCTVSETEPSSGVIGWQCGSPAITWHWESNPGVPPTLHSRLDCGAQAPGCATSVLNRTWGQVKGLYR